MPRKAKIAMILAPFFVVICGVLFVYDAAKGLVLSAWYRPRVASNFKHDFDAINPRLLNGYGIAFDGRNKTKDCGPTSGYPGDGTSIFTCHVGIRANPVVADEAFVKKWRETSSGLEGYLLSEGWRKEWNKAQPIDEILNNFSNDGSIGVNYSKKHGKVTCRLTLMWLMPETPNHLNADEMCEVYQSTWGW